MAFRFSDEGDGNLPIAVTYNHTPRLETPLRGLRRRLPYTMHSSPYPQIPVDQAVASALAAVRPTESVTLGFESALGLVLAAAVDAPDAMPPFPASSRDGFAIRAGDGGPEIARTIVGEAVAGGVSDLNIGAGEAARITTGAPMPSGADAVIMVEDVAVDGRELRIDHGVSPGENVRPIGEDHPAGARILEAGAVIGSAEIGLLASVGAAEVEVHRRPRVAVLSTGDELVAPGQTPGPGQIRDSNRFSLAAAAREAGADVVLAAHVGDEDDDLDRLEAAIAQADIVVTAGGVSMGHRDRVKPWLAERGEIVFGRVRTKPGKPVTLAVVDGRPVFALPGFPVSALVCFELFARPAILRMTGRRDTARPVWRVRAGHALRHADDRVEFQRAIVTLDTEGVATAHTTGFQGSGRLLSMAGANALLRLPEGVGLTPEGALVPALILGEVRGA